MERKLAAIFSSDVKGYSRLMGDDEEATIHTIKSYRQVISDLIEQHHGRVVDSPGDNMLAEFPSAVEAVKSSIAIQQELKTRNAELEDHRKMEFRIGLNVGDVIADEGRLYGDGVNIAARLEGLADPGGICLSEAVHTQVQNKLSLQYAYIGEREVKNIAKPVPVYKVQLESDGTTAPTVRQERPVQEKEPSRHWSLAALAIVAVLLVGGGTLLLRPVSQQSTAPANPGVSEETPALPLPDKPSLAVLPFTNMSDDPTQEYFSDGMTEDLITDLSQLSGLFVIARNSTFTYKGQAVKVQTVGRELGVRYVLEGSVRRAADRVRINAQLIEAPTGYHVWADRYDRDLQDIFALQDEIVQKIVFALKVTLTPEEQQRLSFFPTDNLEAYEYVMRGQAHYYRYTKEAIARAQQLFEKAIELDPEYAGAHSWLCFAYMVEWMSQWGGPQSLERAFELAQRTVALDDSLSQSHITLAYLYLWKDKDHEQAIAELEHAIALDPNFAAAYATLGQTLNYWGKPEEAIELLEKAMRLNPHYPAYYLSTLGTTYRLLGQYEEALAIHQRVLARHPDFWFSHLALARIYIELGREEEARAEGAEVLRINPNFSLEVVRQTWPIKEPAELERSLAALRQAGLE